MSHSYENGVHTMSIYAELLLNSKPVNVDESVRDDQTLTSGGGFAFRITPIEQVYRFLFLGSSDSYLSDRESILRIYPVIRYLSKEQPKQLTDLIMEVKDRVPRKDALLFTAVVYLIEEDNAEARRIFLDRVLTEICTNSYTFLTLIKNWLAFGKRFGRVWKRGIHKWYTETRTLNQLIEDAAGFAQRSGLSHRNVLRLSRPKCTDSIRNSVIHYLVKNTLTENAPEALVSLLAVPKVNDDNEVVRMINRSDIKVRLENLSDQQKTKTVMSELLLKSLRNESLIRNLRTLTSLNIFDNDELRNFTIELIKSAKVHPIKLINALYVYSGAETGRSSKEITPNPRIVTALNDALELRFKETNSTNKKFLVGLDISSSMTWDKISGYVLNPLQISAALAYQYYKTEPNTDFVTFSERLKELDPMSFQEGCLSFAKTLCNRSFGYTDLGKMIEHAITQYKERGKTYDAFIMFTDNEVNHGRHCFELLDEYRKMIGNEDVKFIINAMTAGEFTVGDPNDNRTLNLSGFDSAYPSIIADFVENKFSR